jgi:hypothetical protein
MNAAAPFRVRPRGGSMTVKNQKKWWKKNNVAPPCLGEALKRVTILISTFILQNFHGLGANNLFMHVSTEPFPEQKIQPD